MISNHVLRCDIGSRSVRVITVPARGKVKSGTVRIVFVHYKTFMYGQLEHNAASCSITKSFCVPCRATMLKSYHQCYGLLQQVK